MYYAPQSKKLGCEILPTLGFLHANILVCSIHYVLSDGKNHVSKINLKRGILGENQFDKVKMQFVQNASTERLHKVHGSI